MSNINPLNIDGTYPIAGQDNDSQGFRDNFTNIKNNFTFAKSEIEDLAQKVVLKSALSGGTLNNDFGDALVVGAKIADFSEVRFDHGTQSGAVTLSHTNGHYQTITTAGSITLGLTTGANWPAPGALGRIRLELEVTDTAHTLILPNEVSVGLDGIPGLNGGNTIAFGGTGKFIFEFTTEDGGSTIAINDLTRGRHVPVEHDTVAALTSAVSSFGTSLSNVGLGFAVPSETAYKFEAFLPFGVDSGANSTFSVQFGGSATCYYTVEMQTSPTSAFTNDTLVASNSTDATVTSAAAAASVRMAKITGVVYNISGVPGSPHPATAIDLRASRSTGTLSVLKGANIIWKRIA